MVSQGLNHCYEGSKVLHCRFIIALSVSAFAVAFQGTVWLWSVKGQRPTRPGTEFSLRGHLARDECQWRRVVAGEETDSRIRGGRVWNHT